MTSSTPRNPLRCAVVGVGRMGRHHARIYAQMSDVEFVGVFDTNAETAETITAQWGGTAFPSVAALVDAGVDAVTIATPTIHHVEAAEVLLPAGVACMIEKPLAPDADTAQRIADLAAENGVVLQVGHVVRYDPVMVAIGKLGLGAPRFVEMDRVSPMTFRSIDVGVVLDMMIHDLDLLLMLTGAEPVGVHASAVSVLGEAEDVCNARLAFDEDEGCVANVTASRLALKTERKIRIITEDSYVSADFVKRSGTVVRKTSNDVLLQDVRQRIRRGDDLSDVDYLDLVQVDELAVGDGEPLLLQTEDFLDAVRRDARPTVDAEAGFAAVRTAERIVEAARAAGARMV